MNLEEMIDTNSTVVDKKASEWGLDDVSGFLGLWVVGNVYNVDSDELAQSFVGRFLGCSDLIDDYEGYFIFEGFRVKITNDSAVIMQLVSGYE